MAEPTVITQQYIEEYQDLIRASLQTLLPSLSELDQHIGSGNGRWENTKPASTPNIEQ